MAVSARRARGPLPANRDHLLFFPEHTDGDLVDLGVFDFDAVIFKDLREDRITRYGEKQGRSDFQRFTAWAISDHRPLWAQFKVPRN